MRFLSVPMKFARCCRIALSSRPFSSTAERQQTWCCSRQLKKSGQFSEQLWMATSFSAMFRKWPLNSSDHQVVAPVATEGENRRELIHRGLALFGHASP